jgi:hypothetical protein
MVWRLCGERLIIVGSLWILCRSQFSGEEMRRMDVSFKVLDLFSDSTMRLLSYETMLNGVLTGSEEDVPRLHHATPVIWDHAEQCAHRFRGRRREAGSQGVGVMDTCGFPLFSHDLHDSLRNLE